LLRGGVTANRLGGVVVGPLAMTGRRSGPCGLRAAMCCQYLLQRPVLESLIRFKWEHRKDRVAPVTSD
jgi:hypothetical protein